MKSSLSKIRELLHKALILNGEMVYALYQHEVEEHIPYWKQGMRRDGEDFLFVVTEHSGHVAMVLIEKDGKCFVNEQARDQLRSIWHTKGVYENNITLMIPAMADSLFNDELFVTGVHTLPSVPSGTGRPAGKRTRRLR
jgi:hypothetical protein